MPDDELLARVLAEPDDLEAKIVYADALIERGDPRGQFISEQIVLARMDSAHPKYAKLYASTLRLLARHGTEWLAWYLRSPAVRNVRTSTNFASNEPDRLMNAVFEDGFVRRIGVVLESFDGQWEQIAEQEPVEGIELVAGVYYIADSLERTRPALPLRRLKITADNPGFFDDVLDRLLKWDLSELHELDVRESFFSVANGERLWPRLDKLRTLRLTRCQLDDEVAVRLLQSEASSALRVLDLDGCALSAPSIVALRARDDLALRELGIGDYGMLSRVMLGALAGWRTLTTLERISLPPLTTPSDLAVLFPEPSRVLRHVRLRGAKALARVPEAIARMGESITHLSLDMTELGDEAFAKLVAAPSLRGLVDLDVESCKLTDDAVLALTRSPLTSLVRLNLARNDLTERGRQALAEWPGLANVTELRT